MAHPPLVAKKLALLLISALTMMSGATIAAALPAIERVFADVPQAGLLTRLVLTLPALGIVLFSPLAGWLADRYGRTPLLKGSLILYAIAGVAGVWVNSLPLLLVSRFLLGTAIAGSMTTAVTLIGDYFQGQQRASFLGAQSAFMGFGGVVFIALGGWLAEMSWHAPFWLYALSLIVLPLSWWALDEPPASIRRESAVSEAGANKRDEPEFKPRLIGMVYLIVFAMMVVFYATPTQGPFYLNHEFHASTTRIGLAISAVTLGGALGSLAYGRIKRRLSYSQVYTVMFVGAGLGYVGFGFAPTFELAAAALFISGLALGLLMPNSSVCLMDLSPASKRGRVIGGMSTAIFLGQFASPLLTQPLLEHVNARQMFELMGGLQVTVSAIAMLIWTWYTHHRTVRT